MRMKTSEQRLALMRSYISRKWKSTGRKADNQPLGRDPGKQHREEEEMLWEIRKKEKLKVNYCTVSIEKLQINKYRLSISEKDDDKKNSVGKKLQESRRIGWHHHQFKIENHHEATMMRGVRSRRYDQKNEIKRLTKDCEWQQHHQVTTMRLQSRLLSELA